MAKPGYKSYNVPDDITEGLIAIGDTLAPGGNMKPLQVIRVLITKFNEGGMT